MKMPYVIDVLVRPRCIMRRTTSQVVMVLCAAVLVAMTLFVIFQRWWIVPIAAFAGFCFIVHPVCLMTGHTHKHPNRWP